MATGGIRRLFKRESSTEEEIIQLVHEDEGELEKSQREIIKNVFDFSDTTAGDIMTHRTDMVAVELHDSIASIAKLAIEEGYSRIPVYEEELDNIKGIVYVKDLLKFIGASIPKDEKISDYIREAMFVPETISCGKLFSKMNESHIQLAIVVDEYGGTAGLVTLEDIIEELVGEIEDEYDEAEENIEEIADNVYKIDSETEIDEVEAALEIKIPEGDYNTIAGFIVSQLGFVPKEDRDEGAQVEFDGVRFTIMAIDNRQIDVLKAEIYDRTNNNN